MSALHAPRVRAGSLLELALGVRSVATGFDAILARYAPDHTATLALDNPDDWQLVLLGAIAVRARLELAWPAAQAPASTSSAPALEDLLR
jgi:hypothetical protein